MIITNNQNKKISEAKNAGFSDEEALEYAEIISGYFEVQIGTNDAGRDDFQVETWQYYEAYTTLDEAEKDFHHLGSNARIVGLNGEIIQAI